MEQWLTPWCTCGTEIASYGATITSSGSEHLIASAIQVTRQFLKCRCFCRINLPNRKRRDRLKELERASPRESFIEVDVETASEASSEQDYSYEFAQMEVIMKTLGNNGTFWIICLLRSTLSFALSGHSCTTVGGPRFFPPTTPAVFHNNIISFAVLFSLL